MNRNEREDCIERIGQLPARLRALLAGLDESQLDAQNIPGEWSVAQNVHHLADSHMHAFLQCRSALSEENPLISNYDQDRYVALPDACGPPVSDSLDLLDALHARWVVLWRSLDESKFERTTRMLPDSRTAAASGQLLTRNLDEELESYAQHGEDHLDQILKTMNAASRFDCYNT